ncbi:GntR family transcriptional regulator [Phytoactinopolyspora halotolerans]|uniref:GntR family transcriptional regulator n=1 Tax=Phytoactinopolyspora halotolerans TaxID=1981512 RepID=A0A6L9S857_9ACTN|nr:GntR family transcriptional regulator [Phytoactinopolyspora halotolerans]NEE00708.1 GntR family transcriptional regulator [Phytoactinopolyspora halotolerans]
MNEAVSEPVLDPGVRVGERVYRALRHRIVMGELEPGERLSVPALARALGVSRSPVRDAVLQLVREGLAAETLNRGAIVASISRNDLVSLYEAREALEGMAARLATPNFTHELRRRLLTILTEHDEAVAGGDFDRHIEVDAAFHFQIRAAAGSPVIARMLDEIQGKVMIAMRSTSVSGGMDRAVQDHRRIFEAIAAGDPDASEAAARRHIARLTELLRTDG